MTPTSIKKHLSQSKFISPYFSLSSYFHSDSSTECDSNVIDFNNLSKNFSAKETELRKNSLPVVVIKSFYLTYCNYC